MGGKCTQKEITKIFPSLLHIDFYQMAPEFSRKVLANISIDDY